MDVLLPAYDQNPNYYNSTTLAIKHLSDHVELVETTLSTGKFKCIAMVGVCLWLLFISLIIWTMVRGRNDVSALNLGMIAAILQHFM